jgi:hypothetical protein
MSSIEAPGIRLDLNGPRPSDPPHSLVNTEGVVVERSAGRWLNGVNLIGYPDETPVLWEPCSEGTFRDKVEGTARPQATFDPFVAYIPVTCSTFGWEDIAAQAEAVLDATISFAVEQALADSNTQGNPFLGDGNLTILGGGAVPPAEALAYLENAIGATARKGMIHADPAVVSRFTTVPLDARRSLVEQQLYTVNGTPVVSGDGYIGVVPGGQAALSAAQSWAFATGPVEVRLAEVRTSPIREALDREINLVTFRAERYFLVTWDTALQAGVLVDWST